MIKLILMGGRDDTMACSCIRLDYELIVKDPACQAHEGTPAVGDHRGESPPFKKMLKEALIPPAGTSKIEKAAWYLGDFLGLLVVMIVIGAFIGLVLGLINWLLL